MQGDKIIKKILDDATEKSVNILQDAKKQAEDILLQAKQFEESLNESLKNKTLDYAKSLQETYKTLSKIEGKKIVLAQKQEIINDLKLKAIDFLVNLNKNEKLDLVNKIILSNAQEEENLIFNIDGITSKDILNLSATKKFKLKIKESKTIQPGLILSNDNCDKNLLFCTLVENLFVENELKINDKLFI